MPKLNIRFNFAALKQLIIMRNINIGLVQMNCTVNKEENLQKAAEKIREAAQKGAQIVCLQELFTSLYFCDEEDYEKFKLAEPIPGPSTDALSKVAKETGVAIIASLFEKRAAGLYHNTTAIWHYRRINMLGSVVPGSCTHNGAYGCRNIVLSNSYRLGRFAG